jgi:hypothetical protein
LFGFFCGLATFLMVGMVGEFLGSTGTLVARAMEEGQRFCYVALPSQDLWRTIISELEEGNEIGVLKALHDLDVKLGEISYESSVPYWECVEEAISQMEQSTPSPTTDALDAPSEVK